MTITITQADIEETIKEVFSHWEYRHAIGENTSWKNWLDENITYRDESISYHLSKGNLYLEIILGPNPPNPVSGPGPNIWTHTKTDRWRWANKTDLPELECFERYPHTNVNKGDLPKILNELEQEGIRYIGSSTVTSYYPEGKPKGYSPIKIIHENVKGKNILNFSIFSEDKKEREELMNRVAEYAKSLEAKLENGSSGSVIFLADEKRRPIPHKEILENNSILS